MLWPKAGIGFGLKSVDGDRVDRLIEIDCAMAPPGRHVRETAKHLVVQRLAEFKRVALWGGKKRAFLLP